MIDEERQRGEEKELKRRVDASILLRVSNSAVRCLVR